MSACTQDGPKLLNSLIMGPNKQDVGKDNQDKKRLEQIIQKIERLDKTMCLFRRNLPIRLDGTNYPIWHSYIYNYCFMLDHNTSIAKGQSPRLISNLITSSVEPEVLCKLKSLRYEVPSVLINDLKLICDNWEPKPTTCASCAKMANQLDQSDIVVSRPAVEPKQKQQEPKQKQPKPKDGVKIFLETFNLKNVLIVGIFVSVISSLASDKKLAILTK